jgi:hypothetical protein
MRVLWLQSKVEETRTAITSRLEQVAPKMAKFEGGE